jgi:hypothetical protein
MVVVMRSDTPTRRRLSPELIEALINCRVCELRVVAARTALDYARMRTREALKALDIDRDD